MSVSVTKLSKIYDEQKAVDNVSFEVKSGDILGFLGPNGAGKSTTMKVITCFLPQTAGKVEVCGMDTLTKPNEVKRKIGYLPESNPLYYDMYVREYLKFIAGLHPDIKDKTKRVGEMIGLVGLEKERNKKIGALSKGYKQRVGLAQAMLHDPEVLIMDEPTSGLDPNQIVEVRKLIQQLGKEKTVILSTHIMQEVQAMCNRVIIINKGKLVADSTVDALRSQSTDAEVIVVSFKEQIEIYQLEQLPDVERVEKTGTTSWKIYSRRNIQEEVFRFAVDNKLTVLSLSRERESLEDVFRQLTQN
jgi:ABC-2 type transport system ATP-binding protein